jgi:hypothetical protein
MIEKNKNIWDHGILKNSLNKEINTVESMFALLLYRIDILKVLISFIPPIAKKFEKLFSKYKNILNSPHQNKLLINGTIKVVIIIMCWITYG